MKKIIACLTLALFTSACGYHLRGSIDVPKELSQLYISAAESKGPFVTELRQLFKSNRINVIDDSNAANYSLNILNEKKEKRTAGVGADALSSAYEITLSVDYEIRFKDTDKVAKSVATSVRSFNYNTASLSSAAQEEILLEKEMRRDLAQQILRRLSAVVKNPPVDNKQ